MLTWVQLEQKEIRHFVKLEERKARQLKKKKTVTK
jgi:hypothetical protein